MTTLFFYHRKRSQTQGCYTIANRPLKLTHVFIILAQFALTDRLMDAIIFAAGRGERLRPLTDICPKPLIQIGGLCLIEIHLYRLASAGFSRVIINLHHLGHLIREKLGNGNRYGLKIIYSNEPDIALETAGGIVHALPHIQSKVFAAISADVLCDVDFNLLREMEYDNSQGTLLMVNNPAHHAEGDFVLDSENHLLAINAENAQTSYTFSGIACFKRALFEPLASGKRALRPILNAAIDSQMLYGQTYSGLWSDIGSIERLEQARQSAKVEQYIDSIRQSIN